MGFEIATTTLNIVKAVVTRCLFVMLSIGITYSVVDVKKKKFVFWDWEWWLLLFTLIPLFIETTYTLVKRKGAEFKWFAPSFFCFLVCTVPGIWIIEIEKQANGTSTSTIPIRVLSSMDFPQVIQQVFMLLLVFSRWILPKGEITRDRLSQILLIYIALASDIIELFDLYETKEVMKNKALFYIILVAWTLSLMQFTLVLAGSKSRKSRMVMVSPMNTVPNGEDHKVDRVEVMSLVLTMALQDIPFLCIRIYVIAAFKKLDNTLLFFAAKNAMIIALQLYRLSIVVFGWTEEDKDKDGVIDGLSVSELPEEDEEKAGVTDEPRVSGLSEEDKQKDGVIKEPSDLEIVDVVRSV